MSFSFKNRFSPKDDMSAREFLIKSGIDGGGVEAKNTNLLLSTTTTCNDANHPLEHGKN